MRCRHLAENGLPNSLGQAADQKVGLFLLELFGRVRRAGGEDHGSSGLARLDTGRRVLDDQRGKGGSLASPSTHEVWVRSGLSVGDGFGRDKDLGRGQLGDGQRLGRVEKGGRRADGPTFTTAPGFLLRAELLQQVGYAGQGLDTLTTRDGGRLSGVEDGRLESQDLGLEELGVGDLAPFAQDVDGSHTVCGFETCRTRVSRPVVESKYTSGWASAYRPKCPRGPRGKSRQTTSKRRRQRGTS